MKVCGHDIANDRALANIDLLNYVQKLKNFRGIFMRDALPLKLHKTECGIVNLNTSSEVGSY